MCCDAAIHGAQIERDARGHAKLVVDARLVAEAEETEMAMLVLTSDDQRVATHCRSEVALIFLPLFRSDAAADGRIHRDFIRGAGLDVDRAVDLAHLDAADRAGRPAPLDMRHAPLRNGAATGHQKERCERIDDAIPAVHRSLAAGRYENGRKGFRMITDGSHTTLLRIAALLGDALSISRLLVVAAALLSYTPALIGAKTKAIEKVNNGAIGTPT